MDRARRAEPHSNATIWTREIARNLAWNLARISKTHSCVDTKSRKTKLLPKFQHSSKRCATSPVKARHPQQHLSEQQLNQSAVNEGDEGGPEQRDDERDASLHASQTARNDDGSELKPMRRQRTSPKKKARAASKKSRMEADRLEVIAHENQRMQERLAKIASPGAKTQQQQQQQQPRISSAHNHLHSQSSGDSMWDLLEKSQSRIPHDYNKKQEQLKIWTENQALAKRLRTAKGTLNCKEWEKDDKWNQHLLKSQEKRRIALQQELLKAQMSPLAASVVRVTQLNQRESSPETRSPSTAAIVSMVTSHGGHAEENNNARATAANHRRIMMLRKQRSAPSKDQRGAAARQLGNQCETEPSLSPSEKRGSDTDVVSARFTFSRERRPDPAGGKADSLTIDSATCFDSGGHSDDLFAPGAFSPAVELESALDALGMDQIEPEAAVSSERDDTTDDGCVAGIPGSEEDLNAPQSPLEQSDAFTYEEINAVVFDALQDSIDLIADALSDQLEIELQNATQTDENQCDRQPETHEADQIVPEPPLTGDVSESASRPAIDLLTGMESGQSAPAAEAGNASALGAPFERVRFGVCLLGGSEGDAIVQIPFFIC